MDNRVKEAVDWATERLENLPSERTQQQYLKIMKRLLPKMKLEILPGSATKRNTRSVERAAFRFSMANEILKHAESNPEYVLKVFAGLKDVELIANAAQKKYQSGKNPETGKIFPNHQKRESKRPSLTGLDADWREQLIELSSKSKYANEIRLMAICGCRPEEIENEIELKRFANSITITIHGAKHSEKNDTGQAWRTLTFDSNHPLIGIISAGVYKAKAKAVGDAITHFGKKISSNKKHPISAYSFRHAAASNFKASGLSIEEIAAALGHRSTATMSFYGTKSRGTGMLVLRAVAAASPVRTPNKKSKSKRSKI